MLNPWSSTILRECILIDGGFGLADSVELNKSEGEVVLLFKADALDGSELAEVFAEVILSGLGKRTFTSSLRLEI